MGVTAQAERTDRDERRELLAEFRANGVEQELREGKVYAVIRLPDYGPRPAPSKVPVIRHAPGRTILHVG